ncbi:MAG: alpha-isopropylmalate synthase regulatory domain-containing protein, partial [Clostridia bacterium]
IAAVKAGATHIQGTFLGFGERCGNANLSTIIANLALKEHSDLAVNLLDLTKVARTIAEIANITLDPSMPYVGSAAFAHKAGMHSDAVAKNPQSFEHISPSLVGNKHHILLSEMAGRATVAKKLENILPALNKSNPKTKEILDAIKEMEMRGYEFEGADGSFVLLAERIIDKFKPSFVLDHYTISATKPEGVNSAEVSIKVDGRLTTVCENGNGPVNAIDKALRHALQEFFPQIAEVSLVDYKVRVVNSASATGAVVRVLITSRDKTHTWTTVGVSSDIIEASWLALVDSLEYKLNILT